MRVDFETKCEQTALDYIKIHLQEGYLVTAYKDVGNYYWESVYKIRASLSTNRKTEPQTMVYPQVDGITPSVIAKTEPQTDCSWR